MRKSIEEVELGLNGLDEIIDQAETAQQKYILLSELNQFKQEGIAINNFFSIISNIFTQAVTVLHHC